MFTDINNLNYRERLSNIVLPHSSVSILSHSIYQQFVHHINVSSYMYGPQQVFKIIKYVMPSRQHNLRAIVLFLDQKSWQHCLRGTRTENQTIFFFRLDRTDLCDVTPSGVTFCVITHL